MGLAKKYLLILFIYAFACYIILSGLIMIFQDEVASLFTNQPEILYYIKEGLGTMLLAFFFHGMGKSFEGAARGLGK